MCCSILYCTAHNTALSSPASPVVADTTAGVALLVPLPSAHAEILYWAPGTAELIVTLLPLPVFSYSPIIGTPKRITSYPAMTLVALPCAVVSYTTCELVTLVTVTPGEGTVWKVMARKGILQLPSYIVLFSKASSEDVCLLSIRNACIRMYIYMYVSKYIPLGKAASPMGAVEGLPHWPITDLSTSVCASCDCSFVKVTYTCWTDLTYVCGLCLLLITPHHEPLCPSLTSRPLIYLVPTGLHSLLPM